MHPHWNNIQHFVTNELQPAFQFDAQQKSHPMTYYVESPDDIEDIFDMISYSKG